jgi:hypothetical protein
VIATFVGQGCIQAVAEFDYRATVPMPRGTYEVTIEHHDALPPPVTYVVGKSTVRVIF